MGETISYDHRGHRLDRHSIEFPVGHIRCCRRQAGGGPHRAVRLVLTANVLEGHRLDPAQFGLTLFGVKTDDHAFGENPCTIGEFAIERVAANVDVFQMSQGREFHR